MSEKAEYSQLELFSSPQKDFSRKEFRPQYKFSFGQIKNYEKQILATVILLITGIIAFSLGVEKGKKFAQREDFAPMQTKSQDIRATPRIPVQPKIIKKKAVAPAPLKNSYKYYTIQLASYKSKSSAEREAKVLKNKGFVPVVLSKGQYTVLCTGNFPDKKKALALLPQLKKKYQDCFVRRL